jgi:hypothetical protein
MIVQPPAVSRVADGDQAAVHQPHPGAGVGGRQGDLDGGAAGRHADPRLVEPPAEHHPLGRVHLEELPAQV